MTHHPLKPLLLDLLRQAQSSQNAFFQQVPEAEQVQSGTPGCWSAKDHVAHLTFWRQRLALRLQAILQNAPQPEAFNFEQLNPLIFEEHRARPWSAILPESDQAYADLIALTAHLTEEDLTTWGRFDWMEEGLPLYIAFMGNCYEHTQVHLAQYLLDRHEPARALEVYEVWVRRVVEASVPDLLKGYVFYNLACFYATHSELEKAGPALQQAFTLYPASREFALTDPDLVALRPDSSQ
ncbi:MAG TPA: ClbS/DfsB family four-helix bundle protein [Ktedonobacterales bacterium]|nr:ClbS/DfsB family four-helix bundle protein [Ktedonobacterales bacterium]